MKVMIIGGGQVGKYIANMLGTNDRDFICIEKNEKAYLKLTKLLPREKYFFGDATNPDILEQAGIASCDTVLAVTSSDEVNLVVSTIAKYEFGIGRVIARVNNLKNDWLYDSSMGVDVKFNYADVLAHIVSEEINLKNLVSIFKISKSDYSITQFHVSEGAQAQDKAIKDLPLPNDVVLIAIQRNDEIIIPRGDVVIYANDHIMALTNTATAEVLNGLF